MTELDCRSLGARAGARLIETYNSLPAGESLCARLATYGGGLRIWLLEAGIRHQAVQRADGSWELTIRRGLAPAQGTVPGVHHVVTDGTSVWTAQRSRRVARIDVATGTVAAEADVAITASHLALDGLNGRLIIADPGGDRVIVCRASDLEVLAVWDAPGKPQLPAVSREGVVCVTGGGTGTVTLGYPDGSGYRTTTVEIGLQPHDPLMSRDGTHVWIPCAGSGEVVKVRISDGGIAGRCAVGDGPTHLAGHPDTGAVYAANSWDGTIAQVSADGELLATARSGGWAHAIDITPDGDTIWVANFLDDTVTVFDGGTLQRRAVFASEAYAHGMDISHDGRSAVVTGYSSEHALVFDVPSLRQIARIRVGAGSSHTAFDRDGRAYVGCSVDDHIAILDPLRGELTGTIKLLGGAGR